MSTLAQPSPTLPSAAGSLVPYRVMVVDDSVVIRGLLTKILEKGGDITVVASAANGEQAIKALDRYDIEVIVLDIEMPVMGGMTALPLLLERDPKLQIIIASTLSLKNAEVSLRALSSGAADYIPKPTATSDVGSSGDFGRELLEKVRGLGNRRRSKPVVTKAVAGTKSAVKKEKDGGLYGNAPIVLRKPSLDVPQVLAIGSSTGGPQALFTVLENLGKFGLPIFITQHMPPTFTAILAAHIARISEIPCAEAVDGERVEAGKAYMAPGGFHMVVEKNVQGKCIRLLQTSPENFCRPAVDPMLRSLAELYGSRVLALILTGMGRDGSKGCEKIVAAGGTVVAQDEATSVVWGMPGAVATTGLCSTVLPLVEIPTYINERASGRAG